MYYIYYTKGTLYTIAYIYVHMWLCQVLGEALRIFDLRCRMLVL